jgi:hypothetical protein
MPAAAPHDETAPAPMSPTMKTVVWISVAVPLVGTVAHVALLALADGSAGWTQRLVEYRRSWVIYAVALLACANFVVSWLHYRRTSSGLAIVARILTYLWIISLVFIWKAPAADL